VLIYENGVFLERLTPPDDGYWYNSNLRWSYTDRVGGVGRPIVYEFYLEDELSDDGKPIVARVIVNFYSERQSDALLLERTEFVVLPVEEELPPPPEDRYVRLFFTHRLYGTAIYFHVMSRSVAASYHQRTGASFLISDTRKMPTGRYLVIETGGSRQ
jgi:hypothetical protein